MHDTGGLAQVDEPFCGQGPSASVQPGQLLTLFIQTGYSPGSKSEVSFATHPGD